MEELYDGYSRRQMLESFQSLMSTMPDPPGLDVHQDKISSGDFVVVGSAEDIGGGRRAYKLGRATKDGKRPILDLVHGLSDGRVVTTSIEVVDVDPILADRVSEAVWLWGKISAR